MGMVYRSLFIAINVSPMHTILQMPYYDSAMRRKMFSFWSKEKQTEKVQTNYIQNSQIRFG